MGYRITNRLLSQLDGIIDFSLADSDAESSAVGATDASAAMFAELARSIRPVDQMRERETGRILVVDDIATNRDLLSRRLTQDGHRVGVADGGDRRRPARWRPDRP